MDLLELLRKGGMDGDVDFLREALRVLVEGIMDAEVSSRIGAECWQPAKMAQCETREIRGRIGVS